MDFLLSHPLSRRQVIIGKYLALVAIVCGLATVFGVSLYIAGLMIDDEVTLAASLRAGLNLIPIVLLYGTVSFSVACLTLRRQTVLGISSAVAVSTWVLHGLSLSSDVLAQIEEWTVFHWYATGRPFSDGLVLGDMAILLLLSGGLMIIGISCFERRDI